ncbi:Kinesin-4 [Dendrobium catenatum]|uniref:Kinesin-4 n=1 Tax=Dendrobium catenatum TaxID=906689 RepID=A0A2I0WH78_9ASPA|nr:Kinesin-4 [Dendrobium catenatum]
MAMRKAEEAASRRFEAVEWLRKMDRGAVDIPLGEPSEEEFCLALRNGLILCNVLNKVNPGAIPKVFKRVQCDNRAQSAIQYFENMRNFLVAVNEMKLLTFEASDIEKGGSSFKVVDCILCLKAYHEWKLAGGCIRVYCRVRPTLINISDERSTIDYIGENGSIIIKNPHKQGRDARKIFSFNRVFGMNSTQAEVFADTKSLIRSVIDGYNVCIFAYGQTGSGKTYTMSGANLSVAETWGVSYRSLNYLFDISKSRTSIVNYDVSVQMVEIYNEQVRDLLVTDGCMRRLDIRNNSQLNGLNIPDAKLVAVTCTQDVLDLMKAGLANRSVGATALNERSSRSHSVLTIHVKGKELASGSILKGCLHLVDLAGSERVEKSEVTGERLKEAQHINRSLSALGDVISALAQKSSHIPYRNSKLTQVLQDSLGIYFLFILQWLSTFFYY